MGERSGGEWRSRLEPFRQAVANPAPLLLPLSALGVILIAASFIPYHGWDLHSYWTMDPAHPYSGFTGSLNDVDTFRYAPPVALLFAPLTSLPWPVLEVLWLALQLGALWVIGGRWALALVVFPPVWLDITYGNTNLMLAAAVAVGFRYPATWAWVLLTKVTPGVGLVWFLVRREWRSLALVAGAMLLVAVPTLIAPGMWADWSAQLRASTAAPEPSDALPVPLAVRMVLAALLVAWGARSDRRWTVGVAATLAMPVLWPIAFAVLVSALPGRWSPTSGPARAR